MQRLSFPTVSATVCPRVQAAVADAGKSMARELQPPCEIQDPVQSSCMQAMHQPENGQHQPAQPQMYCKQQLHDWLVEKRLLCSSAVRPSCQAPHSCKKQPVGWTAVRLLTSAYTLPVPLSSLHSDSAGNRLSESIGSSQIIKSSRIDGGPVTGQCLRDNPQDWALANRPATASSVFWSRWHGSATYGFGHGSAFSPSCCHRQMKSGVHVCKRQATSQLCKLGHTLVCRPYSVGSTAIERLAPQCDFVSSPALGQGAWPEESLCGRCSSLCRSPVSL